jgi:VanZ family protein
MIRNLLPGILWGIVILILSGVPGNYVPSVFGFLDWISPDKLVHLMMYAVFVFVLLRGLRKQKQQHEISKNLIYSILGIGIAFGGITEVLQNTVFIRRNGNIYDFIADIIGCLIGLMIYLVYQRKKNRESRA